MTDLAHFAAELEHASHALRRLDKDTRRELSKRAKDEVAAPLAAAVAAKFRGPWAEVLASATKARASADPTIVTGGTRRVVSGGASPRDLVFGAQFGGGRRRTTRQFARHKAPTIYPTIVDELPTVLERTADLILDVLDEGIKR